ncbi:MAG: hypothetical protein HRF49_01815 [bacterium]|jgi:hypothetical protein
MHRTSLLFFVLAFVCCAAVSAPAVAQEDLPSVWDPSVFIGSREIKPGMTGIARTVIFGSRIDEFQVTVIQVAHNRGFNNRAMLLCRAEGWAVDLTGGIAGGMSGSPVYFDGRLGGAISGHWSMTDQKTCIVTPIDQMLRSWEPADARFAPFDLAPAGTAFDCGPFLDDLAYPYKSPGEPGAGSAAGRGNGNDSPGAIEYETYDFDSPVEFSGVEFTGMRVAERPGFAPPAAPGVLSMSLAAMPLSVSSSDPRIAERFAEAFGADPAFALELGLPFSGGEEYATPQSVIESLTGVVPDAILEELRYPSNLAGPRILEPGCVLGVKMIRGDLGAGGYGTLTYVDNNGNFLAFGHASGRDGFVTEPATNGVVYYVPASWQRAGKRALTLDTVGTVFQDRGGAIAGRFGVGPAWIPVSVRNTDAQTGESTLIECEVLDNPDLTAQLAAGVVGAGLGYLSDRAAGGTVFATISVDLGGLGKYIWETAYLGDWGMSAGSSEVSSFLSVALRGEGEAARVASVFAESTVYPERKSFRIDEARLLKKAEAAKLEIPDAGYFEFPAQTSFEDAFPDVKAQKIDGDKLEIVPDPTGKINLLIEIAPWHSDKTRWLPVSLRVPIAFPRKNARLQIWGGGGIAPAVESGDLAFEDAQAALRKHIQPERSAEGGKRVWLEKQARAPRGMHLVVELVYADKPEDADVSAADDLPFVRKLVELDGVALGYLAGEGPLR